MPIYEFKCRDCGHEFEELIIRSSEKVSCPLCGQNKCEKWMSSFRCGTSSYGGMSDFSPSGSSSSSCGSCGASSCAGCGSSH